MIKTSCFSLFWTAVAMAPIAGCELKQACETDANCPNDKSCQLQVCVAEGEGEGEGEGEEPPGLRLLERSFASVGPRGGQGVLRLLSEGFEGLTTQCNSNQLCVTGGLLP